MKPYIYIYVCMYVDTYVYTTFTNYHQLNYNSWNRVREEGQITKFYLLGFPEMPKGRGIGK